MPDNKKEQEREELHRAISTAICILFGRRKIKHTHTAK